MLPGDRQRPGHTTDWDRRPGRAETARLSANAERALANEAGGPVAQLLPVPQDGGDGVEDTDPLAPLKSDIAAAKGNALLVETTAGGWQEGRASAPQGGLEASPPWPDATGRNGRSWPNPPLGECWRLVGLPRLCSTIATAPRSAKHIGNGRWALCDRLGGSLAVELTEKLGIAGGI